MEEKTKNKKSNKKKFFSKKLIRKLKVPALCIIALLLVGLLITMLIPNKEGSVTTITKSTLQKIVEINELSTVDYVYNAIATKYDKNNKDELYHVAYEGTVTAGIDFNKIEFDIDQKSKKITITTPDVEIQETRIDMGNLEFIFMEDAKENAVSQDAYKLCKADLEKRVKEENLLFTTAKENAISSVTALFQPWIETVDKSYKIEIK